MGKPWCLLGTILFRPGLGEQQTRALSTVIRRGIGTEWSVKLDALRTAPKAVGCTAEPMKPRPNKTEAQTSVCLINCNCQAPTPLEDNRSTMHVDMSTAMTANARDFSGAVISVPGAGKPS